MPAGDYVLKIKIDDSELDKAIKRLQLITKSISIELEGGAGSKSGSESESREEKKDKKKLEIFRKMHKIFDHVNKKLVLLTGISFSLGALVGLLTDASPMLGSILHLLKFGIFLIFRPIGDFIALMLRPIMMLLLTQVILPFYKIVYPFFRDYGNKFGEWLSMQITSSDNPLETGFKLLNLDKLAGIYIMERLAPVVLGWFKEIKLPEIDVSGITEAWDKLVDWVGGLVPTVEEGWNTFTEFMEHVQATTSAVLLSSWLTLTKFFTDVLTGLGGTVIGAWENLVDFFEIVSVTVSDTLLKAWSQMTKFFADVWLSVKNTLKSAWDGIANFFLSIWEKLKEIWNKFQGVLRLIGSGSSSSSSSNNPAPGWGSLLHATGGIINEPVHGIGQITGRGYTIGEAGPEVITPLSKTGLNNGINLTVTVGTIMNQSDMDVLINKIKQVLLAEQARRGVV